MSILFNRSFREGKFASIYKHSNVIPLPKKGDNSDPSNFRPISLLSNVGKLQERIVFKHSTTFQLIDRYHHICQTFYSNQYSSCMVFLDVSRGFDRLWHKGLIFKFKQNGIDGELLELITEFLSGRKKKVVIRNTSSNLMRVKASVPQGSVLGPLLFLVYINDIAESLFSLHRPRWLSWMRRPTGDQEVAGSTPAEVGNILSWRLIMKYFLRSFSPFR